MELFYQRSVGTVSECVHRLILPTYRVIPCACLAGPDDDGSTLLTTGDRQGHKDQVVVLAGYWRRMSMMLSFSARGGSTAS